MADNAPDIKGIFLNALDEPSVAARRAYLVAACRDLPGALERVEALLEAFEQAGSFLEVPAIAADATTDIGSVEPTFAIAATDALEPVNDARTDADASALDRTQGFEPAGTGPPIPEPLRPITEGPGTRIGPYKLLAADRRGRHGRRLHGRAGAARPPQGRAQDHQARDGHRPGHRPLRGRAAGTGADGPPQHRQGLRRRRHRHRPALTS